MISMFMCLGLRMYRRTCAFALLPFVGTDACAYVCIFVYVCVHAHMLVPICVYAHVPVIGSIHVPVPMCVLMCVCMYVSVCVHKWGI